MISCSPYLKANAIPITHLDNHSELDFLAMIRDGTLVVQRSSEFIQKVMFHDSQL